MNPLKAVTSAFKQLTEVRHSGIQRFFLGTLARTRFNYAKEVGTGIDASVVTAPVQWVQRAFPEARLRVVRRKGEDVEEVEGHDLPRLVRQPNPFYSGDHLWSATILSYLISGNAYWLIVRNSNGKPVELWWVPWWTVEPKWPQDGSEFISHYEYRPGGVTKIDLDFEDVVHFRCGIDPRNPRLGLSPIHGALREIFMDLQSSNFVASLLRNLGIPGVVISPEGGASVAPDDVEATKAWFKENFSGDRVGDPLIMGASTKVDQFGFDPKSMDLSVARNVAEERVCASIGIPAAVVGFGAGLQTAKVGATMRELRLLAWTNGVLPISRVFAGELERSLLPEMGGKPNDEVDYDTSGVVALEEETETRFEKWDKAVRGGWARVDQAKAANGMEFDDSDRIYLRPFSTVEVPAGAPPRERETETDDKSAVKGFCKQDRDRGLRFVQALERMSGPLEDAFSPRVVAFFRELGKSAGDVAMPLLEQELKQIGEDEVLAGRILDAMGIPARSETFKELFERHFLQVAEEVAKAGDLIGLATGLPDPVARAVIQAGGRRAGLIDLGKQSRQALFNALAKGRAEGEGAEQLAERIIASVEDGPWTSPEIRARVIARTETKFAQNVSTIARSQHEGVDNFIVFDGRLGPGRSTPEHIERDGISVSADRATQMASEEHPNGTLSFSPSFEETET